MPLPTIPSGNVASATAGGFEVANSCRFNDGDSPSMSKSIGTPTHANKGTVSCWVKRGALSGATQGIFSSAQGERISVKNGGENIRG